MLNFISFLLLIGAYILLYKINLVNRTEDILNSMNFINNNNISIKKLILIQKGKKKENIIVKKINEMEQVLKMINKGTQLSIILLITVIVAIVFSIMCVQLNNIFLGMVVFVIIITIPYIFLKQLENKYRDSINIELETTMSVITSSYERNNNIVVSIEENLEYINSPVKEVFEKFNINVKINPNIIIALEELKKSFTSPIFKEWVDNLILCQRDSTIKYVLMPIVNKMASIRILNTEKKVIVAEDKMVFTILAIFALSLPIGVKMIGKAFVGDFLSLGIGKFLTALLILLCYTMYIFVLKITELKE